VKPADEHPCCRYGEGRLGRPSADHGPGETLTARMRIAGRPRETPTSVQRVSADQPLGFRYQRSRRAFGSGDHRRRPQTARGDAAEESLRKPPRARGEAPRPSDHASRSGSLQHEGTTDLDLRHLRCVPRGHVYRYEGVMLGNRRERCLRCGKLRLSPTPRPANVDHSYTAGNAKGRLRGDDRRDSSS
jgi:hypothetical protein